MKRLFLAAFVVFVGVASGQILHPESYIEVKPIKIFISKPNNGTVTVRWWSERYFKYMLEVNRDVGSPRYSSGHYRWANDAGWMTETFNLWNSPSLVVRVIAMPNEPAMAEFGYPPEWIDYMSHYDKWMSLVWAKKMMPGWERLFVTPWGLSDLSGNLVPSGYLPSATSFGANGVPRGLTVAGSLNGIVEDLSWSTYRTVYDSLGSSDAPKYSSSGVETNQWSGTICPGDKPIFLYIRTDDGSRVTVNNSVMFDKFNQGTSWQDLAGCFASVCCLEARSTNRVVVKYSNLAHSSGDIDGVTLMLIGDDVRPVERIVGDLDFDYYGLDGGDSRDIWYNGHEKNLVWTVSPNLHIDAIDDAEKRITVSPRGPSDSMDGDWIRVTGTPPCGGALVTSRVTATVFEPTALLTVAFSNELDHVGDTIAKVDYQLIDQFGRQFAFLCLVSEETWFVHWEGDPTGIEPDAHNVWCRGDGSFTDTIAVARYHRDIDFHRGQRIWAHRTLNAHEGSDVRLNDIHFHPPIIRVTPLGQ